MVKGCGLTVQSCSCRDIKTLQPWHAVPDPCVHPSLQQVTVWLCAVQRPRLSAGQGLAVNSVLQKKSKPH